MVVECEKCGEYAYATRFKDSAESVCRHCRYYRDHLLDEEGFDLDHEINDSCLYEVNDIDRDNDMERWSWEPHEPGDGMVADVSK